MVFFALFVNDNLLNCFVAEANCYADKFIPEGNLIKPTCIADFNKYMSGVDRTDQLRGTLQNPQVVQEGGHPLYAAFNAQQLHCLSKSWGSKTIPGISAA